MARPPALPAVEKMKVVLKVLSGAETIAEAARRINVSEQSVGNWKRQFIEGGLIGLEGTRLTRASTRESELTAEIEELKTALGEAYVELRVWKRSGDYRRVPLPTSS